MKDLISSLTDKDDAKAFAKTKEIASASELADTYYPCLGLFAALLKDKKSYIRTRAFILCCSQARWDDEGKLKALLPELMALFHDPKPTVVRQCLNAAKELAVFRPELHEDIKAELSRIHLSQYKDTMAPLIHKDILELLELLAE